ncbi:MAG: hypothetical protein K2Y26_08690 [Gemmatimonadaceae bacterium]|nr:hypothetical protein [Gemmatimonadaceae bacterium]
MRFDRQVTRVVGWATCALGLGAAALPAQGRGMMHRDSTTAEVMQVVHQLMVNHDKLRRTVVNLPNGVRTVTESDDPTMVTQIQRHVTMTGAFVAAGHDPNLPMSTPALRGVLQNGKKIVRQAQATAKGMEVVETSDDPATVALLQQHAAEITELVKRGMAAMHGGAMAAAEPAAVPRPAAAAAATAPSGMQHMRGMNHQPGITHQPGMAHQAGMTHEPPTASARPTRAGQEAFATIAEIVRLLDADPATDWSKVDLEALRAHLRDMDDVTLRAEVRATPVAGGAVFDVQGIGRVREAIRRMALSHGSTIGPSDGFTWTAVSTATGARVTIRATRTDDLAMQSRIRALGFVGMLTLGDHHTAHHLGIANGSMRGSHQHH